MAVSIAALQLGASLTNSTESYATALNWMLNLRINGKGLHGSPPDVKHSGVMTWPDDLVALSDVKILDWPNCVAGNRIVHPPWTLRCVQSKS